jgi:D-beta-D-heptose 7-phosphate kinase/D-beta-D-heptose 1-phosphate adenosyltransferase
MVVGDVMLDRYLWGDVERISPEAPIPVLKVAESEERLGGAGSVVTMLAALDVDVSLATVVADDAQGQRVRHMLRQYGVPQETVLSVDDRATTVKERLLGRTQSRHPQQMLRVDNETDRAIGEDSATRLLDSIKHYLEGVDAILVSDYAKGVCAGRLVANLARLARERSVPVLADPACGRDYQRYEGCTCILPNRREAGIALGRRIETTGQGVRAAQDLMSLGFPSVAVTLDRDGIAWADAEGGRLFSVRPRQVYDITGAGDVVLATLGYGLAAGGDWPSAIRLANLAGGLEVERLGAVPITRDELIAEVAREGLPESEKIVSPERLDVELQRRRNSGQRIAMTNGCFDLLHPGHVASLEFASDQGDCLVVGLNSDLSVRLLKGSERPIISESGRAAMLAALACVDYVVLFDDESVAGLVERVAPDVLVKSAEYASADIPGGAFVRQRGGQVVFAPMAGAYSTSGLVSKIQSLSKAVGPQPNRSEATAEK